MQFNFLFLIFSPPGKRKMIFQNLWQPSLSQDLVHLKTCGKPCGMFQMIPRCGLQTGLTHSSLRSGGIKEALPGESLSNIKKGGKKTFIPLSIFVTLKALGLTELWFNVICRKAKNVSALMLHYPRIKNARALLFPDDSAIAETWLHSGKHLYLE